MSYYVIVNHSVDDQERYNAEYLPGAVSLIQRHGGEIIAAAAADVIEGQPAPSVVILKFPSQKAFTDWYDDQEYLPLRKIRGSLTSNGFMIGAPEFG